MAMGLYTALPGFALWDDDSREYLAPMLPVVGLCLGAVWCGIAAFTGRFFPQLLAGAVIALAMPFLTGFLHLDGLMDVSDAVLSSRGREEKLRILKDPHTGAFAVIAVVCLLITQVAAAAGFVQKGYFLLPLLLIPVASRALAAAAIMSLKPLSTSQYGRLNYDTATPGKRVFAVCCFVAVLIAAFVLDWRAGVCCGAVAIGFAVACWRAVRSLGGMNGDISGFAICCGELAGLVALACL